MSAKKIEDEADLSGAFEYALFYILDYLSDEDKGYVDTRLNGLLL